MALEELLGLISQVVSMHQLFVLIAVMYVCNLYRAVHMMHVGSGVVLQQSFCDFDTAIDDAMVEESVAVHVSAIHVKAWFESQKQF